MNDLCIEAQALIVTNRRFREIKEIIESAEKLLQSNARQQKNSFRWGDTSTALGGYLYSFFEKYDSVTPDKNTPRRLEFVERLSLQMRKYKKARITICKHKRNCEGCQYVWDQLKEQKYLEIV